MCVDDGLNNLQCKTSTLNSNYKAPDKSSNEKEQAQEEAWYDLWWVQKIAAPMLVAAITTSLAFCGWYYRRRKNRETTKHADNSHIAESYRHFAKQLADALKLDGAASMKHKRCQSYL